MLFVFLIQVRFLLRLQGWVLQEHCLSVCICVCFGIVKKIYAISFLKEFPMGLYYCLVYVILHFSP